MIRSFRDRETEKVFRREGTRKLPLDVQRIAQRKLAILDAAESLQDLRVPPGNGWRGSRGIARGSTGSGSTISGASASAAETATPTTSRSWTTTSADHARTSALSLTPTSSLTRGEPRPTLRLRRGRGQSEGAAPSAEDAFVKKGGLGGRSAAEKAPTRAT